MVEKLIKDGMVAVLYSPGYGAGWYTWNTDYPDMVFDKDIAQAVLEKDLNRAVNIAAEKFPKAYLGGGDRLKIAWMKKGTQFEINEYDGSESIHIIGSRTYLEA